ncbi:MAG: glycolate oxidase subunit GlcF [Steroidobacteraceae bacterium]
MHTQPQRLLEGTPRGREAVELMRACVHCGFCLPACPTYRVTGRELDSPRGRIYLVKQLIEGGPAGTATVEHLDRCLTCRACETACPSGVQYGRIVDLGRELADERVGRPVAERWQRAALVALLPRRTLVTVLARLGGWFRAVLPDALRTKLPGDRATLPAPAAGAPTGGPAAAPVASRGTVALLEGCVQPGLAPTINAATRRVLERLGYTVVRLHGETCCGALAHHLGEPGRAHAQARGNVAAADAALAAGATAIVSTASACGLMVKDYARLLDGDAAAARVAAATRDVAELVTPAALAEAGLQPGEGPSIAWQAPCTLQHGQRITGRVEALLAAAGYRLAPVQDGTICCGSAGTYSLLQPELSTELRRRKLDALTAGSPVAIATANIGCLAHLREASPVPVAHWIEFVDRALAG